MNHLFVQPHPKTTPRISRQIVTIQEDLSRAYEILTKLYQFPDQTLNTDAFSERLIGIHRALQEFEKSCELIIQSVSQNETDFLQEFPDQESRPPSNDLNELVKEARHAKKLTHQLSASFCKLRLGLNDYDGQSIHTSEVTKLNQEIGTTVSNLLSSCNSDFE